MRRCSSAISASSSRSERRCSWWMSTEPFDLELLRVAGETARDGETLRPAIRVPIGLCGQGL